MSHALIQPLGDQAVVVEFGPGMDPRLNDQVIALHHGLSAKPFPGYIESVPAYSSLTVHLDVLEWHRKNPCRRKTAVEGVTEDLEERLSTLRDFSRGSGDAISVPVCYDPAVAPDIAWVAGHVKLSIEEVVRLHTSVTYRVYMNGFVPGFPYLGILPDALEVPRKSTPALRIASGSVAIAGRQTGIYPFETPGGWQVIGRTPWKLFDKSADPVCLLRPGMSVRFEPIGIDLLKAGRP